MPSRHSKERPWLTDLQIMHSSLKVTLYIALLISAIATASAAYDAPAALPPSLMRYTTDVLGSGSTRVILYESSGTYTEISDVTTGLATVGPSGAVFPSVSGPPSHGSYTYTIDPLNPSHATITYHGGRLPNDELYFATADAGSRQPQDYASFGSDTFALFPLQGAANATNVSMRTTLSSGHSTTLGFVIGGTKTTWVLVRAVGAGLGAFGVSGTAVQPAFTLYDAKQTVVGTSAGWGADPNLVAGLNTVASRAGAFPLSDTSDEGVALLPLKPGAYTAAITANTGGELLCEAYFLPYGADLP